MEMDFLLDKALILDLFRNENLNNSWSNQIRSIF